MTQFIGKIEMRFVTCDCGISWAAPESWFKEKQRNHSTFHCPNGCNRYFPAESKEEKLKRQLESERKCCLNYQEQVESLYRSNVAYKGVVTKLKRKAEQSS